MAKCGCGDTCNCLVVEGIGTDVPGTGNVGNPYVVNVDGSEISGNGIGWVANKFVVRLSPGGGLEFDADGALRTTGGGGGGGGGADVAQLEARTQDVIGASLGGGFLFKPADLLASFTYSLQTSTDFIHVPVRFLADGSPVVSTSETCERTTIPAAEHVQEQDDNRWRTNNLKPGYAYRHLLAQDITGASVPNGAPATGWFGWLENGQFGLTMLSDVLRELGGKVVLLLDLQFPARNQSGGFAHTTPSWRTDMFLIRVRQMIQKFGLSNSVIVTSAETSIPSGINPPNIDVLNYFSTAGIRVGPTFVSEAAADLHPPDGTWPSTWTWVFLSRGIPAAKLKAYVDKSLHTILFVVTRQYMRTTIVNAPAGVGAKGVISADPEYYGGDVYSRRYRKIFDNQFNFYTVPHGLLPAGNESLVRMSPRERGHFSLGYKTMFLSRGIPKDGDALTAWVNQGWFARNPLPTSYTMDLGLGFNRVPVYGWVAVAFSIPTDHSLRDPNTSVEDPTNHPLDNGYYLLVDTNGYFFLMSLTNGARVQMGNNARPYGPPKPIDHPQNPDGRRGVPMYVRIGVNENGIKVSQITAPGGPLGPVIFEQKTALAKQYRGDYTFFGRYSSSDVEWEGFVDDPKVIGSGAPPNGPTA